MYKKLAISTIVSTAAFVIILAVFDKIFGEAIHSIGAALVERNEWIAVFTAFLVSAVCIVPIPDHAVSVLAWIGGLGTTANIAYSTAGSASGAAIAFGLGRTLSKTRIIGRIISRNQARSEDLLLKYGATGIIIACATPFPYSPVCWLAGILGFDFTKFLALVVIFRAIKVTYVLLLAQQGILFF